MRFWSALKRRRQTSAGSKAGVEAERAVPSGKDSSLSATAPTLELPQSGRVSPLRLLDEGTAPRDRPSTIVGDTWIGVSANGTEIPLNALDTELKPAQTLALLDACCAVIKSRGLDTLGIFRPHRTPQSTANVRRLVHAFLRSQPDGPSLNLPSDLFGRRTTSLDELRQELEAASIHDVVSVLHWALRHLRYGSDGLAAKADGGDWYSTWLQRDEAASHPSDSYNTLLAPLLAEWTTKIFDSLFDLIATVAALSETNGMSYSRLCKLVALPVLGQNGPFATVDDLHAAWRTAGHQLERIFLAYLRAQSGLPARLQELTVGYPQAAIAGDERLGQAIRVTLEIPPSKRRTAGDLIDLALEGEGEIEQPEWTKLVDASQNGGAREILSIDAYSVVSELSPARPKPKTLAPSPGRARRSMSVDRPPVDRGFTAGRHNKLNAISEGRVSTDRPLSPSFSMQLSNLSLNDLQPEADWQSFASTGFTTEVAPLQLQTPVVSKNERPNKLRKPQPNGPLRVDVFAEEDADDGKILSVTTAPFDDVFSQIWLDTLGDKTAREGWPRFVLVDLQSIDSVYARMLLIEEVAPKPPVVEEPRRAPVAVSKQPAPDEKRIAQLLGTFSRAGLRRKSSVFGPNSSASPDKPQKSPPTSQSTGDLGRRSSKPRTSFGKRRQSAESQPRSGETPAMPAVKPSAAFADASSPDGKAVTEAAPRTSDATSVPDDSRTTTDAPKVTTDVPTSPVLQPVAASDEVSTLHGEAATVHDSAPSTTAHDSATSPAELKEDVPTTPTQAAFPAATEATETEPNDTSKLASVPLETPTPSSNGATMQDFVDEARSPTPTLESINGSASAPNSPVKLTSNGSAKEASSAKAIETPSHSRDTSDADTPTPVQSSVKPRQASTDSTHNDTPSRSSFETASVSASRANLRS